MSGRALEDVAAIASAWDISAAPQTVGTRCRSCQSQPACQGRRSVPWTRHRPRTRCRPSGRASGLGAVHATVLLPHVGARTMDKRPTRGLHVHVLTIEVAIYDLGGKCNLGPRFQPLSGLKMHVQAPKVGWCVKSSVH